MNEAHRKYMQLSTQTASNLQIYNLKSKIAELENRIKKLELELNSRSVSEIKMEKRNGYIT